MACPDDTVTFTCTLPGNLIRWTVLAAMSQPSRIELFRINLIPNTNINETRGDPAFRGILNDSSGGLLTATLTSLSEASTVEGIMVLCEGENSQKGPLTITVAGEFFS